MQIQVSEEDKVQYISYQNLTIKQVSIEEAINNLNAHFASKQWKRQFDALTELRSLNKNLGTQFIQNIFRRFFKDICMQVDNLRSNNSKQALTLLFEILKYNNGVTALEDEIFGIIITKLFIKSCSEKGFLKTEARQAIKILPKVSHPSLLIQISRQTQSPNYQISELAIATLKQSLQILMITKQNIQLAQYLKILSKNVLGKRALIQKTAKEILTLMQKSYNSQALILLIKNSNITDDQKKILLSEIGKKNVVNTNKGKGSLKDFIKQKKEEPKNE